MTSPADIILLPGQGGKWARREVVEAWQRAGSPPVNSAGRLYAEQKHFYDLYRAGRGAPADNPDRPDLYPLAHVRGGALDIDPTTERVRRLAAAGLVRPYSYEPWHWEVPNVRKFNLVQVLPSFASEGATPFNPTNPATPVSPEVDFTGADDMIAIKSPNRPAVAIDSYGSRPLNSEEFSNFVGRVYNLNDRQYDLAISVYSTVIPWADPRESFVGSAPNRPVTLFAPGYVKVLTPEENETLPFTNRRIVGNDRQYDLWTSMSLQGQVAYMAVDLPEVDDDPKA